MIPHSNTYNWVIGPVMRAIQFVAEETALGGTLQRSLTVLESHEVLLRVLRDRAELERLADLVQNVDRLLREAPGLVKEATKIRENDYSVVNSHSLIAIWGAVEVAVEDTVVLILSKEQSALQALASAGIKTSSYDPGPVSEEEAKKLCQNLERLLRKDLKVGEAYIKLLGTFGITFSCSGNVLSKLEEINSIRNCLLHRGGIIDERAARSSGRLRPYLGKTMPIGRSLYLEYYEAVGNFLSAMSDSVFASSYVRLSGQPT